MRTKRRGDGWCDEPGGGGELDRIGSHEARRGAQVDLRAKAEAHQLGTGAIEEQIERKCTFIFTTLYETLCYHV